MFHVLVGPSSSCGCEPLVLRRAGGPEADAKQPASQCTAVDIACNVVCSLDGHACQATAEACAHAFRVRWHRQREDRLLRKTIDVDIEEKSTGEQSDAEQSDGGQSLGGRA